VICDYIVNLGRSSGNPPSPLLNPVCEFAALIVVHASPFIENRKTVIVKVGVTVN